MQIFSENNIELNDFLNENGFAIVDFLSEDVLYQLKELANKYLPKDGKDFISTSHFLDLETSKKLNQSIKNILTNDLQKLFPHLKQLGGTLASKYKNKSILKAHQDWTIVDEAKYNSYNLWMPLVNTNSKNGTLGLIPKSHKWFNNLRGFGIENSLEQYSKKIIKFGYEPSLKAGQAILYNHKLIHYSMPNTTNVKRDVLIVGMIDAEADLQISIQTANGINTYQTKEEDFYLFDAAKIQINNKICGQQNNNMVFSKTSLSNLLEQTQTIKSKNKNIILKKLIDLF